MVSLCISLSSGCFFPQGIHHEVTPLSANACADERAVDGEPPAAPLDVFWGPELPPRAFARIAHLEVVGERSTTTKQLLAALRRQAQACRADALLGVEKRFSAREHTPLFGDPELVSEKILTGVAIRYESYRELPDAAPALGDGWED